MPHSADWIPRRERELVVLCENWVSTLSDPQKQTAFDWDQAECNTVTSTITVFLITRNAYRTTDSSGNLLVKNEKKEIAIKAMREFANVSIRYNKKMTDGDKLLLGIRPHHTTLTRHPVPTSQPTTSILSSRNHFEHLVCALNHGTTSKPADAHGVRYAWQVGGVKPASGEDLPKAKFSRKTRLAFTYSEAQKSQIVYYATCYENSRNEQGPWSPIAEGVIG